MVRQTGLPPDIEELHDVRIGSGARGSILCQVVAITDIGHSAFSLQNVRQTRIDREDLAGLVEAGVEDEEENQPIPRYPRGTLRLELSDGSTVARAMEYKRLPALELGTTPLGCKVRESIWLICDTLGCDDLFFNMCHAHRCFSTMFSSGEAYCI